MISRSYCRGVCVVLGCVFVSSGELGLCVPSTALFEITAAFMLDDGMTCFGWGAGLLSRRSVLLSAGSRTCIVAGGVSAVPFVFSDSASAARSDCSLTRRSGPLTRLGVLLAAPVRCRVSDTMTEDALRASEEREVT